MTMTMAPPVVQPSLGLMALIQGVAGQESKVRVTPSDSMQDVHQLKDKQTVHEINKIETSNIKLFHGFFTVYSCNVSNTYVIK